MARYCPECKNPNKIPKTVPPPNQVSWEKEFDAAIAPNITEYGGISEDKEIAEEIKDFISSLLKEERVKAYKQGFNKATEYAKYAIATNNMFENSVKAVRKQVKFEASRRAKSKLSKGEV